MERIVRDILAEFAGKQALLHLADSDQFEHFAAYIAVRRHLRKHFDTNAVVVGSGSDTGIDGIAVIVNGQLVTDVEEFEEMAANASELNVEFVFVQAEKSAGFDAGKMEKFGTGVEDFFRDAPLLPRSEEISAAAEIKDAIYNHGVKFRSNPACTMYYITTGKWQAEKALDARRTIAIENLTGTMFFESVEYECFGAKEVQKAYHNTKEPVRRTIDFAEQSLLKGIPGVEQAYIGFVPKDEFLKLITDDTGQKMLRIFDDNVRDFQGFDAEVNDEIRNTLLSEHADRFVLMNNGVTIIARSLNRIGDSFVIANYNIVNGCQTSNVVFSVRDKIASTVKIPLRLISTQDENVIDAIIKATNRQTEVRAEQFAASTVFAKQLERFFHAYPEDVRLYYERRAGQYDEDLIDSKRIVELKDMIRTYAGMWLAEPHRTTRNFKSLLERVGTDIYGEDHQCEPYYAAAYAAYRLDSLFRAKRLEGKYKPARYHILLAARILLNPDNVPAANSHAIEKRAKDITAVMNKLESAEKLLLRASAIIDNVAAGDFKRDNIRTQPFTESVIEAAMKDAKKK